MSVSSYVINHKSVRLQCMKPFEGGVIVAKRYPDMIARNSLAGGGEHTVSSSMENGWQNGLSSPTLSVRLPAVAPNAALERLMQVTYGSESLRYSAHDLPMSVQNGVDAKVCG